MELLQLATVLQLSPTAPCVVGGVQAPLMQLLPVGHAAHVAPPVPQLEAICALRGTQTPLLQHPVTHVCGPQPVDPPVQVPLVQV